MAYTSADFLDLLQNLLPTGPVWPRDPTAIQTQVLGALTPTYGRLAARDENLLVDAFPSTAVELLSAWEESVGLPDPCAGNSPTIQARQDQVIARFAGDGGQTVPYFEAFAAALGYTITVTEFAPRRFGRPFGLPFGGEAWAHTWQVNTTGTTIVPRQFGSSRFGEPYATWGSATLQCELDRIKPAHTILLFNYTGSLSTAPLGEFWLGRNSYAPAS